MADYIITVYTGEIENGGTDADVFLSLDGEKGSVGPFELDTKDHDDFERGENDSYRLKNLKDVGEIRQINISHKNNGKNPSWYLDGVTVKNVNSCGWLAINPKSGLLYTSESTINENSPILIYKIDLDALKNSKNDFLSYHSKLTIYDNDNTILKREHMQGGCFDNENHLHISNGYYTVKGIQGNADSSGGISVFKVCEKPAKNSSEHATRITRSNQTHDFRFQFNGNGDEPEGITYWDLDREAKSPNITGQLHAIMLNNAGTGDDDLYFKHFRRV